MGFDFFGYNVNIMVSDSTVNMIFLLSCLVIYSLCVYQVFLSLPRVKKAIEMTASSLYYTINERSTEYFCSQRIIDIGLTVPGMLFWCAGAGSSVFLMSVYKEMPVELQSTIAFFILFSSAIYMFLDLVPDTQIEVQMADSKYWILKYGNINSKI